MASVKDDIIEILKTRARQDQHFLKRRWTLRVPVDKACDLLKLDRNELGPLADDLFNRGLDALAGARLFGLELKLDWAAAEITIE